MPFIQSLLLQLYFFLVNNLPSDFFKNKLISLSLDFFQWLGVVIFAVSFLLLLTSILESRAAGEYINGPVVFSNIIKAFLLLVFSRPLVIWSFALFRNVAFSLVKYVVQNVSVTKPSGNLITELWNAITGSANTSFYTIIMLVVTVCVFFQMITLYGMYFIQIVTGYFYITNVMRGDQNGAGEWLQRVVASGLTFALEYIFYIIGFAMVYSQGFSDITKCVPGLVLIISSPAIPAALNRWGYSHGSMSARGVLSGFSNAVTGTVSAFTHI